MLKIFTKLFNIKLSYWVYDIAVIFQDWLKGPSALIGWSTALVLVYSVCDARSFDLARFILQKLNVHKRLENGCVMLIGNKNDLEHLREISEEEGRELAHNYGIHFHETSAAVNYDSVDSAFKRLLLDTLSIQITKLSLLHNSSESLDTLTRKNSTVVRDHPTRRSVRRVSLRKSSGSFDSTRDSLSSFSDEENCHVIVTSPSPTDSPVLSPDSSPAVTTKRRKISIPTIFDKLKHTSTKNLPAKMR